MNPLVQPDPGLFIWTIITFLLLLGALAKFAWTPLLAALESRQNAIRQSLDDAEKAKVELERLEQEAAQIIRAARAEADSIINEGRAVGERERLEIRQRAKSEADAVVKNAERQIQIETHRALQQIRREAGDLSVMIASKILQRTITKEDNERLIDDALTQLDSRQH